MIAPVRRFFILVCMEPRLLPGVRCSVLKTVNSAPSCWITMPGRNCVALTLLIIRYGRDAPEAADSSLGRKHFGNPRRHPEGPARGITCLPQAGTGTLEEYGLPARKISISGAAERVNRALASSSSKV